MSWGEVKKINSDLTIPLDVSLNIYQLNMTGSSFISQYDTNTILNMLLSDALYDSANIIALKVLREEISTNSDLRAIILTRDDVMAKIVGNKYIFSYIYNLSDVIIYLDNKLNSTYCGKFLNMVGNLNSSVLENKTNLNSVLSDSITCNLLCNTPFNAIFAGYNNTFMTTIIANSTASNILYSNSTWAINSFDLPIAINTISSSYNTSVTLLTNLNVKTKFKDNIELFKKYFGITTSLVVFRTAWWDNEAFSVDCLALPIFKTFFNSVAIQQGAQNGGATWVTAYNNKSILTFAKGNDGYTASAGYFQPGSTTLGGYTTAGADVYKRANPSAIRPGTSNTGAYVKYVICA